MFKTIASLATMAVASAQMSNIFDLLIMDSLSHNDDYYYYGHGGGLFGNDLMPLLLLGGDMGFPSQAGGQIGLEEYMLYDDLIHNNHHGNRDSSDVLPMILAGMGDGLDTFNAMMQIHEFDIANSYNERFGFHGDNILGFMALGDDELRTNLHDFHVIEGVLQERNNGNGANLLPLAFLTSDNPDVQMENLHQYHYMQNRGNSHNNIMPWAILASEGGNGIFNHMEPIAPYWAMDQIINGDDYYYSGHNHGGGHGGHGGHHDSHSRSHRATHYRSHHNRRSHY